jgi:hypothetical protein
MTLSGRNSVLRVGIALALLSLLIVGIASFKAMPGYPEAQGLAIHRSLDLFRVLSGFLFEKTPFAPYLSMLAAVLYSLGSLLLIYNSFEKTQSPEILFVGLFALSFSFETARIVVPLMQVSPFPNLYLTVAYKALFFGRCFGLFSLFTAGVYASGLEAQKQQDALFVIIFVTLIISLGLPIDGFSWDSSLSMILGDSSRSRFPVMSVIDSGVAVITVLSFFVSAWSRGEKEFNLVGIGTIMTLVGRWMLLTGDNWGVLPPAILLLILGLWCICSQLHKVYLWL